MNRVEVSRWSDFRDQVLKLHVIESIKVLGADVGPMPDFQGPPNIVHAIEFDKFDLLTQTPRYYEVPFGNATQTIAGFNTHSIKFRDHVPLDLQFAQQNYSGIPENFHMSTAPIYMDIKRQDGILRRIVFETNENPDEERFVRDGGLIVLDLRRDDNSVDDRDEVLLRAVNHQQVHT